MLWPGLVSLTMAGRRFDQALAKASVFRSTGASPSESFAAVIGTRVARSQFAGSRAEPFTCAAGALFAMASAGSERMIASV